MPSRNDDWLLVCERTVTTLLCLTILKDWSPAYRGFWYSILHNFYCCAIELIVDIGYRPFK
jgi:hypothetical protein